MHAICHAAMQATKATISMNARKGSHRQINNKNSSLICIKPLNIGIRQQWPTLSKPLDKIHRRHRDISCLAAIAITPLDLPLIPSFTWILPSFSDGWPLWTLLLICAALGQVCEDSKTASSVWHLHDSTAGVSIIY